MIKTENGEELKITKVVVKSVAPDVTAQIFWLKNRQPENWRDRQEHNLSGTLTANIPALDACVAEIMKGK